MNVYARVDDGQPRPRLAVDLAVDPVADPARCREIETAGFDCAWVTETVRDPFVLLTQAALATRRLRLATGVAVAFARNPMSTALLAHDLQRLSGGRFVLGLGTQVKAHITRRFSMPWSRPAERLREFVLAVRAVWAAWNRDVPLEFAGEFFTHTLSSPVFDPGPSGHPDPPIYLGGVGERVTAVAGEVADGFLCGPLTSVRSLRERTLPALAAGRARRVDTGGGFSVAAMPLIATGRDDADLKRSTRATRERLAFYASTPAYGPVLELHGRADTHRRLSVLARDGRWDELSGEVDDDLLHEFAVVGTPDRIGPAVRERYAGLVDRVVLYAVDDPGVDVWQTVGAGVAQ